MSASDFAPLRELLEHFARDCGTVEMDQSEADALSRLLREHAERGTVINAIAVYCVRRSQNDPSGLWREVSDELPRISMEALDALSTPPTEQDDGN